MENVAVTVENIKKRYRIGVRDEQFDTLTAKIVSIIKKPISNYRRLRSLSKFDENSSGIDTLWALNDVSFSVKQGEALGIIGRNGAGKSTLLKILSRITEPTSGRVTIRGRVSCLLEVGTGFHPELTGRENVYLNGTILGMKKREIDRKFDEIVEFSGVSKFIDTPIKRYSSGMKVRLAFSVAAHLEPELLIIDEVLAVGDASFQKKCLDKMEDVGKEGRTVLFVSHNMPAVTRLCKRVIMLDEGKIIRDGTSQKIVSEYLSSGLGLNGNIEWYDPATQPQTENVRLCALRVKSENDEILDSVDIRQPFKVEVVWDVMKGGHIITNNIVFTNQEGTILFVSSDNDKEWIRRPREAGRYVSQVSIPGNYLAEGMLMIGVAVVTPSPFLLHLFEENVISVNVADSMDGDTVRGDYTGEYDGVVRPMLPWTNHYQPKIDNTVEYIKRK